MKNVFLQFVHHLSMAIALAVVGSFIGWLACWPGALIDVRLYQTKSLAANPHWYVEWAQFVGAYYGMPFGALAGFFGYLFTLHQLPHSVILARIPVFFLATVIGATIGSPLSLIGMMIGALTAFSIACSLTVRRFKDSSKTDV